MVSQTVVRVPLLVRQPCLLVRGLNKKNRNIKKDKNLKKYIKKQAYLLIRSISGKII
jgi:hypothetical protein